MEVHKPLPLMPHTMIHSEDVERLGHALRLEQNANPTLLGETARSKSDQGYSLPTPDDSPPRLEEKKNAPVTKRDVVLLSVDETYALFRAKVEDARRDTRELAGSEQMSEAAIPKLTLDLGSSNISRLPESVVDLIKGEVERLSLLHNQIWHIPQRFQECSHLKYLNIKSNVFREIPKGVYKLPLLEILDISRNKIRKVPKDICNLTSLRVFSIVHNRVDDLPTEICEMTKLQVLKVAENPLNPDLKRAIEMKEAELDRSAFVVNEREQAITAEIKRFLRELHPAGILTDAEIASAHEELPMDNPKPMKRSMASRFPVVPSSATSDSATDGTRTSPSQGRPPPIPTRSHHRGISGQSGGSRRSGITPLLTSSERNRSNSEAGNILSSSTTRQRRMGMLRKEKTDLDAIDESRTFRQSHLRGYSAGSALRRNGSVSSPLIGSSSPGSPRLQTGPVMQTIKRLSSLPENNVDSIMNNSVVNGAKGLLYAFHQTETQIRGLLAIIEDHDNKKSQLEPTFYAASRWLRRLNKGLERAILLDPEDTENIEKELEEVHRNCVDCITAYQHVMGQMQECVKDIVAVVDPLVMRTFMLLLYGSIMEIKNAMRSFGIEVRGHRRQMSSGNTHPIQTIPEEITTPPQPLQIATPSRTRGANKPQKGRFRSDTTLHHPIVDGILALQPTQPSAMPPVPHSARLPPSLHLPSSTLRDAPANAALSLTTIHSIHPPEVQSRSNSRAAFSSASNSAFSSVASTPRSVEGFNLPTPPSAVLHRINPATGMTDAQEGDVFVNIYTALSRSYEAALNAIPVTKSRFQRCLETAEEHRQSKEFVMLWHRLIHRCNQCRELSENLRSRLSLISQHGADFATMSPEGGRSDPSFWMLCKTFLASFVDLVTDMRVAKEYRILPIDTLAMLRPVQKASRDAGRLIETSPWSHLTDGGGSISAASSFDQSRRSSNAQMYGHVDHTALSQHQNGLAAQHSFYPTASAATPALSLSTASLVGQNGGMMNGNSVASSANSTIQLSATPLSAALGPAAQATVPNIPSSGHDDHFFRGNVFQRADHLLSMPQSGSINFLNRR